MSHKVSAHHTEDGGHLLCIGNEVLADDHVSGNGHLVMAAGAAEAQQMHNRAAAASSTSRYRLMFSVSGSCTGSGTDLLDVHGNRHAPSSPTLPALLAQLHQLLICGTLWDIWSRVQAVSPVGMTVTGVWL